MRDLALMISADSTASCNRSFVLPEGGDAGHFPGGTRVLWSKKSHLSPHEQPQWLTIIQSDVMAYILKEGNGVEISSAIEVWF